MTDNVRELFDTVTTGETQAILHLRIKGGTQEVPVSQLDIGPESTHDQIRRATAAHFGLNPDMLDGMLVERQPNGNITIRPEAVFG